MKPNTQVLTYPSITETLVLDKFDFYIPRDLINAERAIRYILLSLAGSGMIALCAQVYIPLYPIPITLQTFAVFLIGFTYGWRLGGFTVTLYLFEGALGLPVFAKAAGGIAVFTGPTAGFLFGFILVAIVSGWFAERGFDRSYAKLFISLILCNVILYSLGLFWLGSYIGWDKPVLELGLYPFILGDLLKILLVVVLLPSTWTFVNRLKD